jgi:hypothetical protein
LVLFYLNFFPSYLKAEQPPTGAQNLQVAEYTDFNISLAKFLLFPNPSTGWVVPRALSFVPTAVTITVLTACDGYAQCAKLWSNPNGISKIYQETNIFFFYIYFFVLFKKSF